MRIVSRSINYLIRDAFVSNHRSNETCMPSQLPGGFKSQHEIFLKPTLHQNETWSPSLISEYRDISPDLSGLLTVQKAHHFVFPPSHQRRSL